MKIERFAAVVVLMGSMVWDGFNVGMVDTLPNRRLAMRNAVREYDPFQKVNHGKGSEPISDEIRNLISCENDTALDALPIG